jgi:transcriptional regulator with XRE-family HTH domain
MAAMHLISHERLALLMRENQMGPARLARFCDLTGHAYISRLAAGKARSVQERTAHLMAEALHVPVDLLFVPVSTSPDSDKSRSVRAA